MAKILLVDDDLDLTTLLSLFLRGKGHEALAAPTGAEALSFIEKDPPDVALVDLHLGDMDGLELLEAVRAKDPDVPVIILTGDVELPSAVKAMKLGATDYLTKPCRNDEILIAVEQALQQSSLKKEVQVLRQRLTRDSPAEEAVGGSPAMRRLFDEVSRIAETDLTVILQGESGTGKELVARLIHRRSRRRAEDFIAVDCGALPESLAESELFGHEKGSFTGAHQRKLGLFELALGGTLFLDEIGNLPYSIQVKLLRALQEKRLRRVGGQKDLPFDARVIAASNADLKKAVEAGKFREDLYHRLDQFSISLPPLRERTEDIDALADHFLREANALLRKRVGGFTDGARRAMNRYGWPGNVRELKNIVTRAALLADGMIDEAHLRLEPAAPGTPVTGEPVREKPRSYRANLAAAEKKAIREALEKTGGNRGKAAKILGITRMTLYLKIKKWQIDV